jgi:hypothetical protein
MLGNITPGTIPFTRIPTFASSRAVVFVRIFVLSLDDVERSTPDLEDVKGSFEEGTQSGQYDTLIIE